MRELVFISFIFLSSAVFSQQYDSLMSHVCYFNKAELQKEDTRIRREILEGKTFALSYFEIHTSTLEPGKAPHPPHIHTDQEELVIVKEGMLKVTINNVTKLLGPGGIAMAMPGDEHGFENGGNTQCTYYVLKFQSASMNIDRGKQAGGSFMIDRNDLRSSNTGKGYRVDYFNRATSQTAQFEMHTTALNADSVSHAPHTHIQEEIILLIRGNVTMQIGDDFFPASAGDVIFLSSNKPHALKNTGKEQCEYFAFQWKN